MARETGRSEFVSATEHRPDGFKWLTLKRITYTDPTGRERLWESAERTTRGPVDGVAIIAVVRSRHKPAQLILELQFRPSQGSYVLEFPAGLIDAGESPEQAAVRELREETGYSGRVTGVSPVGYSDPGMTNSNMQAVTMEVDADAPENAAVQPQLEDGEFIETLLVPLAGLYGRLQELQRARGCDVDARLLLYAMGLEQAAALAAASSS